jgi:vanillate O-demethylase monooxygenase subunit
VFVANAWYVAAWSRDVTTKLIERIILRESIVLYRLRDGTAVAMENRCPHRNMPLSEGRLLDDRIRCVYHGLEFDHQGRCTHIPGQRLPAQNTKSFARTYPVTEKYGWVFIWMGDPARADPALVPGFHSKLVDDQWDSANGTSMLKCGYLLVLDNLLDLSHVAYVHSSTNGNPEVAEQALVDTQSTDSSVRVTRTMRNIPPAPAFAEIAKYRENIDRWQVTNFYPPGYIHIVNGSRSANSNSSVEDEFDTVGRWGFEVYWALTPETERSTHGFWVSIYRKTDVPGTMADRFRSNTADIITEDVVVYEAQQRAIDLNHKADTGDVSSRLMIKADQGLLHARKILQRLSLAEQQ